ncbi:hypothetical protein EMN47_20295 [Prolixibacteraceae bacterium JC049]|nr:hypothetical protein [Prolixibacteraceae bacterium JC049]
MEKRVKGKNPNFNIIILLSVAVAVSLLFIIIYLIKFSDTLISSNLKDWASFGDAFNLLIAFNNLIIFVILTIKASSFQKKSFEMSMREASIKEATSILGIINKDTLSMVRDNEFENLWSTLKACNIQFDTFIRCKAHLFDDFKEIEKEPIYDILSSLLEKTSIDESFKKLLEIFSLKSSEFLGNLSKYTYKNIS